MYTIPVREEDAKGDSNSTASTPQPSSTVGEHDGPGSSSSDAIRRHLAEMESSFYDSPTARKSVLPSTSLLESPATSMPKKTTPSSSRSEGRFSGLGVTPIAARTQTLALKEQENIVDKYQKENFSLKMKLYYLEKRLTQLNDDEVKRMIADNIELSTYKMSAAKEIKALNKRIRELQFEVNDRDVRLETQDRASQLQSELAADRHGHEYDTEQELSFMRDRISTYEVEISKLRDQVNGTGTHDAYTDRSAGGRPRSSSGSVISLKRHEAEMETLELQNGHLRDLLSEMKMENQELIHQVDSMNEDLAKMYDHVNANADDSILERSASRARARGNSGSSGRGHSDTETEIESLELANGKLRDDQALLRMQNIELTGQVDLLTDEVSKLHGVEEENARFQQTCTELTDEVERLQNIEAELNESQQALARAQSELDDMHAEFEKLQLDFENLSKEKQKAVDWAKVLTDRIEAMTTELTDFDDVKQQLTALHDTHRELQDHLAGTVRMLKKNEQSQIERIRKAAGEKMGSLEDMISKREADLAVLRSENAGLSKHEGEMYSRMDEMQAELEAAKKQVDTLKAETQKVNSQLQKEMAARQAQSQAHEQALKQHQQQNQQSGQHGRSQQEHGLISVRNSRIAELESALQVDKHRQEALEKQFKLRLQELEKRLVQEREGRLVDRKGARARLLEGERVIGDLKEKLRKLTDKPDV